MDRNPYLYQDYMSESVDIAMNEMMAYIEAAAKDTYYFRDNLQEKYVKDKLAKSKTKEAIIDFTGTFIDSHSSQLYTSGPVNMFTFADKEIEFFYELFGVDKKLLMGMSNQMFRQAYGNGALFNIVREAPHKILLTAILVEAIQKNYEDIITCCKYIMAFIEYPLMYRTFWKLGVKEDVMNYTIEHLPNKFKVKKMNNLLELLKYDMDTSFSLCHDRLKTGLDYQYIDFIYRCRNQTKATFKKIAVAYYDNDKNNASQHTKGGKLDDGTLADQEGHTSNISSLVENTFNRFLSNGINAQIAGLTAEGNQVDKNTMIGFLNQIYTSKNNRLYKFIENVITSYLSKNPTNMSLGSGEFFNFGLTLYRSIGTSKDPMYQEIRSILNLWMFEIVNIENYYQNRGTIINYTRAIFNYFIMMINHHNKH